MSGFGEEKEDQEFGDWLGDVLSSFLWAGKLSCSRPELLRHDYSLTESSARRLGKKKKQPCVSQLGERAMHVNRDAWIPTGVGARGKNASLRPNALCNPLIWAWWRCAIWHDWLTDWLADLERILPAVFFLGFFFFSKVVPLIIRRAPKVERYRCGCFDGSRTCCSKLYERGNDQRSSNLRFVRIWLKVSHRQCKTFLKNNITSTNNLYKQSFLFKLFHVL